MTKAATDVVCLNAPQNPRFAVGAALKVFAQTVAQYHCRLLHRSISRPVGGKYRCWRCLREFDTEF
jgi:hypothetical protein